MKQEFTAVIKQHEGINGAYIEIPFDVQLVFGAKRVKVLAEFNGYPYRGSIVSMGGCYLIGITQAIRKAIGKEFGDTVAVSVDMDEEERQVALDSEFSEALLKSSAAYSFWGKLSYTNKRKFTEWISSAKREETRKQRIEKAIALLSDNKII